MGKRLNKIKRSSYLVPRVSSPLQINVMMDQNWLLWFWVKKNKPIRAFSFSVT